MGNHLNHAAVGHTMNMCWCTDTLGFETSAKALIAMNNIEPWSARELIRENLRKQGELARRSPLKHISVEDGLNFLSVKVHGSFHKNFSREQFVQNCSDLLVARAVQHGPKDLDQLYEIFDAMDFDGNRTLSLGEWAGGLSVFFRGDTASCVHAVFKTLDSNNNANLSKKELQEYLTPFVKAMSPPEADSLRPLLLKKAADDIFTEMDLDKKGSISSQEMWQWTAQGNNVVDRLIDIIDKEVYSIWLTENHKGLDREQCLAQNKQAEMNSSPSGKAVDMPSNFREQQPSGKPDQHYAQRQPPTCSECPTDHGAYREPLGTPTTAHLEEAQEGSTGWDGRRVRDAVMTSDKAWSGPALDVTFDKACGGPAVDSSYYSGSHTPQYGGPPGRGQMPDHSMNGRQREMSHGKRIQQPVACHNDYHPGANFADHQAQVHHSSPRRPTPDIFSSDVGEYRVPPPPPPPKRLHGPLSPSPICEADVGYGPQPPESPSLSTVGNRIPPPALSPPYKPLSHLAGLVGMA